MNLCFSRELFQSLIYKQAYIREINNNLIMRAKIYKNIGYAIRLSRTLGALPNVPVALLTGIKVAKTDGSVNVYKYKVPQFGYYIIYCTTLTVILIDLGFSTRSTN
jgi:hypothetical protein